MKKVNPIKMLLMLLISAAIFTGCGIGKKSITEEDAKKYVEACFKATLKGDVEDYAKLTGESKEEVEKQYKQSLESLESQMGGITGTEADFAEKYTEACKNMLASTKYEVGEAVKDENDNFTVEVKAYPSDLMTVLFNKVAKSASDENIGEAIIQALNDAVNEQSFGDAVSYQVHVNKDSEGKYTIEVSDVNEVTKGLFAEMDTMFEASGKVFDNPYLNWTKTEWEAASEEEKAQCCLAIIQYVMGFTDEDMAAVDLNNADIQTSIQQIKEGIDMTYSTQTEISIGDYSDLIKSTGQIE